MDLFNVDTNGGPFWCVKDNEFVRSIRGAGGEISTSLYTFIQVLITVDWKWVPANIKSEKLL